MKVFHLVLCGLLVTCGGQTLSSGGVSGEVGPPSASGGQIQSATGGADAGRSAGNVTGAGVGGTSSGGSSASGGLTASGGVQQSGGSTESGAAGSVDSGGTSGTGGTRDAGSDGNRADAGPCTFTFAVTTVTYNGRFTPKNVGAIWVEDYSGAFVKTLRVWAGPRVSAVAQWAFVSGLNYVDAVTGATRPREGSTNGTWNCTDFSENPVPHGAYSVCVEIEEDPTVPFLGPPPHYTCQSFNYTGDAASGTWPDQPNFVSMSWTLE
jgi:hypothetical protein